MSPELGLAPLDRAVLAVYGVAVLAHGLWASCGQRRADEYFLAGRALPWYLIGLSLFASNMSGASFVGLMGASYAEGLVVFHYEWTAALVLVLFAAFVLPAFLRAGLYTVPEFLERRFDRRSRRAFAVFTLLAILFVDTAGALYAGGLVLTAAFPGLGLGPAVAALALVAGVYTILGGLRAVVATDAVQAVLLLLGAALVFAFGLEAVGGWSAMTERLPSARMRLYRPADDGFLPWTGLPGVLLLGFYYWTLNQFLVQRTLAARNLDEGRKGALFAGLLKLPNLFLMILPGVFAVLLYPELERPDLVFPTLAFDLLPVGLRGLVLAALVAAILSSLDSAQNAAATLVTMDLVRPAFPELSSERLVRVGRAVTAVAVAIGAVYAPLLQHFETLFGYFQSVLAYVTPPVVAAYGLGLFWRRANAHGALASIGLGLVAGPPVFVLKEVTGTWARWGLPELHYSGMALVFFALGALLAVAVSLATAPPDPAVARACAWSGAGEPDARPARRGRGLADFRLQAGALVALTLAAVAWLW